MTTLEQYAANQHQTITVLLDGHDLASERGGRFSPCDVLDEGELELYHALVPELALNDGDEVTTDDIDEALDALVNGVVHRHRFTVAVSVGGPASRLEVEASGTPGLGYFDVDRVDYVVSTPSGEKWQRVQRDDSRWRFAVHAVRQQVEAGQE